MNTKKFETLTQWVNECIRVRNCMEPLYYYNNDYTVDCLSMMVDMFTFNGNRYPAIHLSYTALVALADEIKVPILTDVEWEGDESFREYIWYKNYCIYALNRKEQQDGKVVSD